MVRLIQKLSSRGWFHQLFTRSVYTRRFQKRKKDWQLDCIFALLGSALMKTVSKMLMKLTPVFLTVEKKKEINPFTTESCKGEQANQSAYSNADSNWSINLNLISSDPSQRVVLCCCCFSIEFLSISSSLHARTRIQTHTHTHTHTQIYAHKHAH